jgi:hypothetical protein
VLSSIRVSGPVFRLFALSLCLLSFVESGSYAAAQTAPQLLPYTSKLIAGGGSTAATKGASCSRAGATPSGYVATDVYGDGCLATEINLTNPKDSIVGPDGAIYFTDYISTGTTYKNTGVVHRIDPITGIVTAVAGGQITNPASAASCSTVNSSDPYKAATGDVFGDGCLATSVKLEEPTGIAFSPSGDLYIADEYAYDVRKVSMSNGGVAAVTITSGGSSYASAPTVTFSAPPAGGTQATGTAVINASGVVTSVTITNAGSGYTSVPTVTFSVAPTGNTTATGTAVFAGVITMAVGSSNGTSATAHGYGIAPSGCNTVGTSNPCVLDAVYSIAFDKNGNLYMPDEFYDALLVLNTNLGASGPNIVMGVTIQPGVVQSVAGYKSGGCTNGSASSNGCSFGTYTTNTSALATELDNPYGVAIDSYGNAYVADFYYGNVAQISAGASLVNGGSSGYLNGTLVSAPPPVDYINSYAGSNPLSHTYATPAASKRGIASTFSIGADYGVGMDSANNLYITDETNGYIWRVDGGTQTMYTVGGGATPPASGGACSTTFPGSSLMSTDAYGDGCPATLASFGKTYLFDVSADSNSDIFMADNGNYLYREIASGANFGNTGASQTDYLEIHFAAGDTPLTTGAYTITSGSSIFTIGNVSCTTNTDSNANYGNSTDCVIAITAAPTTSGAFTGTLTVKSTKVPAGTSFPLIGNFVQSPITRTSVTTSSALACSGTIYATTTPVTLTAALTANGPTAPAGNIIFYANGVALAPATGVVVSNIGTTATPVYGATLTYTFATAGAYTVTATYVAKTGGYFTGSTSAGSAVTATAPTFTTTALPYQEATVSPGQTALYSFTLATSVYTGTTTFACSGLPANSACSFSPTSIVSTGCSATSTVAVSILTQAGTVVQTAGFGTAGSGPWSMLAVFTGVILALLIGVFRKRIPLRSSQMLMIVALLLAASGLTACGKAAGTQLTPPTPAFSGNVTVTATGSDGTVSSFTVPLKVL